MSHKAAFLIFLMSLAVVRADEKVSSAQQALKDQGFYYGEVTGEKDTVTTDAIRRYQIRNGLQVTGDLNDETLRSIQSTASASAAPSARPTAAAVTPSKDDTSDLREPGPPNQAPGQPFVAQPPDQQAVPPPVYSGRVVSPDGALFAGTPYENSPPEVQRRVIVDVQKSLLRQGLFRNEVDGVYSPKLEFSLRAYQSRVGLTATGRLDLETLAALRLLPGANGPVYTPRRGVRVPQPPVRGEWIRP